MGFVVIAECKDSIEQQTDEGVRRYEESLVDSVLDLVGLLAHLYDF